MRMPVFAVIDTSVLLAGLMSPTGASYAIIQQYLEKKSFHWMLSQPLYNEYLLKIAVKMPEIEKRSAKRGDAITAKLIDEVLSYIVKTSIWLDVPNIMALTSDENDDHIATMAVEHGADYLVTLDKDFNIMKKGRYNVTIITPGEFIHILRLSA